MHSSVITKDLITKPALWRLGMELRADSVEVVLSTPYEDEGPLAYRSLPLDPAMPQLEAFEELIYQNPVLLSDFERVDVLIDTNRFMAIPAEIASDDVQRDMLAALWPSAPLEPIAQSIAGTPDALLMGVDPGVLAFIRRTFLDSSVRHPLDVLANYYAPQASQGLGHKLFAHFRADAVIVIAFSRGKLLIANSYPAPSADDAAYFILAAAQTAGFPLDEGELLLSGDIRMREQATPALRRFAKRVMPAIFPSDAIRAGADAVRAPFELIALI